MKCFPIIDTKNYCNFSFPGAGCNNVVIAAERKDGCRIVWRIAKRYKGKDFEILAEPVEKLLTLIRFKENVIAPFINEKYLAGLKIVLMRMEDMRYVAKIILMKPNSLAKSYDDLCAETISWTPHSSIPPDTEYIHLIEMTNAVQYFDVPMRITDHPILTLELKPKGAVFREDRNTSSPYCETCIFYLWKAMQGELRNYSEYCSLKFYSGVEDVMKEQLQYLFNIPQSNLKLYLNGNVVHSQHIVCSPGHLQKMVWDALGLNFEKLLTAILFILSGSHDSQSFKIYESSILGQIQNMQKVDAVGGRSLVPLLWSCPKEIQEEVLKETLIEDLTFLKGKDLKSLVDACRVAITAEDFSIILNLQRCSSTDERPHIASDNVNLAYSTKIIDYDPTTADYIVDRHQRMVIGEAEVDRLPPEHRMKPCIL